MRITLPVQPVDPDILGLLGLIGPSRPLNCLSLIYPSSLWIFSSMILKVSMRADLKFLDL